MTEVSGADRGAMKLRQHLGFTVNCFYAIE